MGPFPDNSSPTFKRATVRLNDGGIYGGAVPTAYTDPVGDPYMRWSKDSKNDRSQENIYEQGKLDSIVDHIKQYNPEFTLSKGSQQRWDIGFDRNQDKRQQEDVWQHGTITDLENELSTMFSDLSSRQPDPNRIVTTSSDGTVHDPGGTNPYAGLTFTPKAPYNMEKFDSEHTNEGMRRNQADLARIVNIQEGLAALDAASAPEREGQKAILSDTYGAAIDETYARLFETDNPDSTHYGKTIDDAGRRYWTEDLLQNRAGLQEGDSYTNWLDSAFRNTDDFKTFNIMKGPKVLDGLDTEVVKGLDETYVPSIPSFTGGGGGGGGSSWSPPSYDYSSLFKQQDDAWNDKFDKLTSTYEDQMNDIKSIFAESNRNQEKLLEGYRRQEAADQERLKSEAAYGERTANQTVKGVKTQNELPGFQPKFKGTRGHFNRTGSRLTTGSLNI